MQPVDQMASKETKPTQKQVVDTKSTSVEKKEEVRVIDVDSEKCQCNPPGIKSQNDALQSAVKNVKKDSPQLQKKEEKENIRKLEKEVSRYKYDLSITTAKKESLQTSVDDAYKELKLLKEKRKNDLKNKEKEIGGLKQNVAVLTAEKESLKEYERKLSTSNKKRQGEIQKKDNIIKQFQNTITKLTQENELLQRIIDEMKESNNTSLHESNHNDDVEPLAQEKLDDSLLSENSSLKAINKDIWEQLLTMQNSFKGESKRKEELKAENAKIQKQLLTMQNSFESESKRHEELRAENAKLQEQLHEKKVAASECNYLKRKLEKLTSAEGEDQLDSCSPMRRNNENPDKKGDFSEECQKLKKKTECLQDRLHRAEKECQTLQKSVNFLSTEKETWKSTIHRHKEITNEQNRTIESIKKAKEESESKLECFQTQIKEKCNIIEMLSKEKLECENQVASLQDQLSEFVTNEYADKIVIQNEPEHGNTISIHVQTEFSMYWQNAEESEHNQTYIVNQKFDENSRLDQINVGESWLAPGCTTVLHPEFRCKKSSGRTTNLVQLTLTDRVLNRIAFELVSDWKILFNNLGMKHNQRNLIEENYQNDIHRQAFEGLILWRNSLKSAQSNKQRVAELCEASLAIGRQDIVDMIKTEMKEILTDKKLQEIAYQLLKYWRTAFLELGMSYNDVVMIEQNFASDLFEQAFQALILWRNIRSRKHTHPEMLIQLKYMAKNIPNHAVIELIKKIEIGTKLDH